MPVRSDEIRVIATLAARKFSADRRMSIQGKIIGVIYNVGQKLTSIRREPYEKIDERKSFRESFEEPKSWLDQSYLQYLCQYYEYRWLRLLLNIFALPVLLSVWAIALRDSRGSRAKENKSQQNGSIAIMDVSEALIPELLIEERGKPTIFPLRGPISFDATDFAIIQSVVRKSWSEPYYVAKVILRVGRYSHLIRKTNCKSIVASAEYSFASSALTELCTSKNVVHVNIMHGEKFLNQVDAFCGFHEFYVWDDHYIALFKDLRARVDRYIVAKPKMLTSGMIGTGGQRTYDFTYYLGWELSLSDLKSIRQTLDALRNTGRVVCVRKHPLYGDRQVIGRIFESIPIEDPQTVGIEESLAATGSVISLATSVFWLAQQQGKGIIVDDVSNQGYYDNLIRVRYLWVEKEHCRLSDII